MPRTNELGDDENDGPSLAAPLTAADKGPLKAVLDAIRSAGLEGEILSALTQRDESKEARLVPGVDCSHDANDTPYLRELESVNGAAVRHARNWRPSLLAALRHAPFIMAAARVARVDWKTVEAHRTKDTVFDELCSQAEQEGREMLRISAWSAATEGRLEGVYFQGILVGHVRKYPDGILALLLKGTFPEMFDRPTRVGLFARSGPSGSAAGELELAGDEAARLVNILSPVMGARALAMMKGQQPAPLKTAGDGQFVRIEDLKSANPAQEKPAA